MARPDRRRGFAAAVRLRLREALRRPVVIAFFVLQAAVVAGWGFIAALDAPASGPAAEDLVLLGLRVTAVPGGLVFGVLVAAVVGADFTWATERTLLARDPRRSRFVRLHLTVAVLLGVLWTVVHGLLAGGAGVALEALTASSSGARWTLGAVVDPRAAGRAAAAALAAALVYGLLGAACALVFRGGLAGVVALLAYGLLGELVLAPRWELVQGWTVYEAAAALAAFDPAGPRRAGAVLGAAALAAILASLLLYGRREVRS